MRSIFLVMALCLAATASAQMLTPPRPSSEDGLLVQPRTQHPYGHAWQSSSLKDYRLSAQTPFTVPAPGSRDHLGRSWNTKAPMTQDLIESGGTLRLIFLGAPDFAVNAVGYCYDGLPGGSASYAWETPLGSTSPLDLEFGDCGDLRIVPGDLPDFWVTTAFGTYSLLDPANSTRAPDTDVDVLWTNEPLLVPTHIPDLGGDFLVQTWIASVTERNGNDLPHSFRIAIQQYPMSGAALVPIPEPSTFAWAGVVGCMAVVAFRRCRRG